MEIYNQWDIQSTKLIIQGHHTFLFRYNSLEHWSLVPRKIFTESKIKMVWHFWITFICKVFHWRNWTLIISHKGMSWGGGVGAVTSTFNSDFKNLSVPKDSHLSESFPLMRGRYSRQAECWEYLPPMKQSAAFWRLTIQGSPQKRDFVIVDQFYRQKLAQLWTRCLHKLKNLIHNSEAHKKGIIWRYWLSLAL